MNKTLLSLAVLAASVPSAFAMGDFHAPVMTPLKFQTSQVGAALLEVQAQQRAPIAPLEDEAEGKAILKGLAATKKVETGGKIPEFDRSAARIVARIQHMDMLMIQTDRGIMQVPLPSQVAVLKITAKDGTKFILIEEAAPRTRVQARVDFKADGTLSDTIKIVAGAFDDDQQAPGDGGGNHLRQKIEEHLEEPADGTPPQQAPEEPRRRAPAPNEREA